MAHAIILAKQTEAALLSIIPIQAAATRQATSVALHVIEREMKANLSLGSHPRGWPTNSAPGSPPDLVSGDLRRSVQVDGPSPVGASGTKFQGEVGPTIEYARIQELGGIAGHGAHLPARPYAQPAFEDVMPEIRVIYREHWDAALSRIKI